MDQRKWMVCAGLATLAVFLGTGCQKAVTRTGGIVLVSPREALGGWQVPETLSNTPPPPLHTVWPEPRYPAPGGRAEWAVANARPWRYIVVHHSDTDSGSAAAFDRYHRSRGWENGLGYHFVIGNGHGSGDGQVEVGPRWRNQIHGAHAGVEEYNQYGIGICLVGNFEAYTPTPRQMAALKELVNYLAATYHISRDHIKRHKDVKFTKCPGRFFPWTELFR